LIAGTTLAATSTIVVTSTPFLSFTDIPDSISIGTLTVPIADTALVSDTDGNLPVERHLTISDTRGCGGLTLQIQAAAFTPASTQIIPADIRVVTSTNDQLNETVIGNVEYISGFAGDQTITAPRSVASTTFSDSTLFTNAPFDTVDNTLTGAINLLDGDLTAPAGRTGQMHVSTSFYLLVPKLTLPDRYYTTLTYTLSDNTIGVCP
ncbi:hypothetical protein KJ835_05040, partial [Patescibacteria group bacterium]|nr:hypothetical protein [Patescibacteria group bacterium]